MSDTSPLLNLERIERLDLLPGLYGQVLAPAAVSEELSKGSQIYEGLPWLSFVSVLDRALVDRLSADLDPGEAEAIALAIEKKADLILVDEKRGRRIATANGLQVTGLLGVLASAKRKELIPEVKTVLDELSEKAGFWLAPELRSEYLQGLGEE